MNTIALIWCRTWLIFPVLLSTQWLASSSLHAASSADLWQARNGTPTAPTDPVEWVKGNSGPANSHYAEGYSIPYRLVASGLSPGHHQLVVEWDTQQSGHHAIDYVAYYDRLLPHNLFGQHTTPEAIHPLDGLNGGFAGPNLFPIPAPSSADSPVAGQPTASFQALPASERLMAIWNGTITNISYVSQGSLTNSSAATRLSIDFVADSDTAVIAWGGHIARREDWGAGNSATGISGSSYHMRLIALDGSGGNQDRSVQATAVVSPPSCLVAGPDVVCAATTNSFTAMTDQVSPGPTFQWALTNNRSDARIIGSTNGATVRVAASAGGSYSVAVIISIGSVSSSCARDVLVQSATSITPLVDQTVCPRTSVTFSTTAAGTEPFAFVWRKGGNVIAGATDASLTVSNVAAGDAGVYCVEVTGTCGSASRCATLAVQPLPVVTCPPDITLECLSQVPPPDPASVILSGGAGEISVTHLGDSILTNDCQFVITRTYSATDSCGSVAVCHQTIRVIDTTPPELTCVASRNVECGDVWDFNDPTATDACGDDAVILSVVDTRTNALGGNLFSATRTWAATDPCGNQARCQQTITVVDTTPPQIDCSTNIIVACSGSESAPVFFSTTAVDICDPQVQVTCTPPSGTVFQLGAVTVACLATDASGNSSPCSFQVTVRDFEPPQISCPSDITLREDPPGSGSIVVIYPAPIATDNCDTSLAVSCSPPSGSSFPVGDNLVTCLAQDADGNTNVCSFTVRVVPYLIVAGSPDDSGPGTLRQALLDANAASGANVIAFNFSGPTPYTIHLLSPLPPIVETVLIDGWSQNTFAGSPVIQIDGSGLPAGTDGLVLEGGNITVRGLAVSGFAVGMRLQGDGGHVIQGNYIGAATSGNAVPSNAGDGVYIASPGNLVGGSVPAARNVISGNGGSGIHLDTPNAVSNVIQGNFIGTAADGVSPLGNGQDGILLSNGAANNLIGGTTPGAGNIIAFNGNNGVTLAASAGDGNGIRGNVIVANAGLGIDLGGDGVSNNDVGDPDEGPNHVQNSPVLSSAGSINGITTVVGSLNGTPNAVFQIEFFLNDAGESSSEGRTFLGAITVMTDATGNQNFTAVFSLVASAEQFITATATDADNNTSEFSQPTPVGTAPVIITQPAGTSVVPGAAVKFCVTAIGAAPLLYQWRLNGANLPDETNACLNIPSAQLANGGTYTVVVANQFDAVTSDPALLLLIVPPVAAGDNFVDRVPLFGTNGVAAGTNFSATREPGEPTHGKPGGSSVWYKWTAPADGIATFRTTGSTFDTLLAVYTGSTVTNLTKVQDDDDRGGFFASGVSFNTIIGAEYEIAIDGFGGAMGEFVFSWSFIATNQFLPVITNPPVNLTVAAGDNATFSVGARPGCFDGHHDCRHASKDPPDRDPYERIPFLLYQWFVNGQPIPGATNATLTVTNVQEDDLGNYTVRVKEQDGAMVDSLPASLQINVTGQVVEPVQATDKFLDAVNAPGVLRLGKSSNSTPAEVSAGGLQFTAASVVRGYTGTQIFNTTGSTTEGETICGVVGGASQWIPFVAEEQGTLSLNTDGSSFDTVMAIFARSPTNATRLDLLACDNNSGLDAHDSALSCPVEAGKTNFIVIDGVNGATGILKLNYTLVASSAQAPLALTAHQDYQLRLTGYPSMHFTVHSSSNLVDWSPLLTTNSATGVFDFADPNANLTGRRFYRAVVVP